MFRRLTPVILIFTGLFALACSKQAPAGPLSVQQSLPHAVNINTAPLEELQKIPHIGESLARKIVEHRETNGPFRRVEHLMLIQGVSDKRYRKIRPLVRVE
jgi:competence protein ComEA